MRWFLLVLMMASAHAMQISEVDPYGEWMEIYSNESINISHVRIQDNYQTDTLRCCSVCNMSASGYILIQHENATYCVDDKAIGNGLGNSHDVIILHYANASMDVMKYNRSQEDMTWSNINGTWYLAPGTPGYENQLPLTGTYDPSFTIESYVPQPAYTQVLYRLFRINNEDYKPGIDTISLNFTYNISNITASTSPTLKKYTTQDTGEWIFEEGGEYTLCGTLRDHNISTCFVINVTDVSSIPCNVSLDMEHEKQVYEKGEKILYSHHLSDEKYPFQITYWVTDIYDKVVKKEVVTRNTNLKRYTPQPGTYLFHARLNTACNNTDNQTYVSRLLAVKDQETEAKSSIIIEEAKVDADKVQVKVSIVKGDTKKYAVKAYIRGKRRASDILTLHLRQGSVYRIAFPLALSACKTGTYDVVVEGLGTHDTHPVLIECPEEPTIGSEVQDIEEKKKPEYELLGWLQDEEDIISVVAVNPPGQYTYKAWSYVYRGSKVYSRGRYVNQINMTLNETEIIILKNSLNVSGDFRHKVKILRDDRKTPKEFTHNVSMRLQEQETMLQKEPMPTGSVVYQSSSVKAQNYTPYLIIAALLLGIAAYRFR